MRGGSIAIQPPVDVPLALTHAVSSEATYLPAEEATRFHSHTCLTHDRVMWYLCRVRPDRYLQVYIPMCDCECLISGSCVGQSNTTALLYLLSLTEIFVAAILQQYQSKLALPRSPRYS
jgi:hypothetical protein